MWQSIFWATGHQRPVSSWCCHRGQLAHVAILSLVLANLKKGRVSQPFENKIKFLCGEAFFGPGATRGQFQVYVAMLANLLMLPYLVTSGACPKKWPFFAQLSPVLQKWPFYLDETAIQKWPFCARRFQFLKKRKEFRKKWPFFLATPNGKDFGLRLKYTCE